MALQTKTLNANGSKGHHKFTLKVNEETTSGNSSFVSYTFTLTPIQNGWDWYGHNISYSIVIGSNTYNGTIPNYNGSSTVTLKSGSNIEIQHDTDGTKTINVSFNVVDNSGQSYTCGNASASDTFKLTDLHKAPTLDSISFVENSSVLQNIGLNATDFVPYLSNKTATIQATPYDGATITQYRIINGTTRFTSTTNTINLDFTLDGVEMAYYYETSVSRDIPQIIIEITDDKGGVSSYNYTNTTYVTYAKPNLVQTSSSVKRNGQLSGKVIMNVTGTYYGSTIGTKTNTITLSYKYWKTSESEPSTYFPINSATTSGNIVSVNNWNVAKNGSPITDVDGDFAYYFKVKMVDGFSKESYITLNVPVGEYIRAILKNGVDFKNITIGLNPIVESGTGYVKYYDGTMICYGTSNTGTITWSQDGIIYYSANLTLPDFVEEFISTPIVTKTIQDTNATRMIWITGNTAPSTTNPGTYNLSTYWNATSTNVTVSYIAIGKWK